MPSASDLCKLYDKESLIKEFIEGTIRDIEMEARHGEKYKNIDIPIGLKCQDIEAPLIKAFPECKVSWKWFLQCYQIRWA